MILMHHPDRRSLFETWYEREMPRLFNYVSYLVRDRAIAEDLTAAICERALTRLHHYDPRKGTLDAWMFTIARNTVKNHFRSAQRNPQADYLGMMSEVRSSAPDPEEAAEIEEVFRQIASSLHQLSEQEQEVVALRFGADLSNLAIAEIMQLTPNHVSVLLHRALNKLHQALIMEEVPADV